MLIIEREQLKIWIFWDKLIEFISPLKLLKHWVILFPPKNCNAPKIPPLNGSLPDIPILLNNVEPLLLIPSWFEAVNLNKK